MQIYVIYISKEKIRFLQTAHEKPYEREYYGPSFKSALIEEASKDTTAKVLLNILRGCRVFHFHDTSAHSRMRMPAYVQDDRYLRSDGGNLAAYLYRLKNDDAQRIYYDRIVHIIREVFPRFHDFSLHPRQAEGRGEIISLNWKEKGYDSVFGPHQLSDGTLRFMALCTLLLRPRTRETEIIVLDEPEIGLHPFAVRVLSDLMHMVSGDTQIIVTTQSKELLNAFAAEDVIVADFDEISGSSRLRRLSENAYKEWLSDYSLAELWDKNIIGGTP